MKIGIVGGTGKMGSWFASFFEKQGHEVLISGRTTPLTKEKLVEQADIVIVSVPIMHTVGVIEEIAPLLHKEQLLMDFTSVKTGPVEAMLRSNAEVIGCHPLFNEQIKTIEGQHVVLCPVRASTWEEKIKELFPGASIITTTPEEHDRMMTVVQVMNHFNLISFGHALASLQVGLKETKKFSTPIYELHTAMAGRVLVNDPGLYAHIGLENKETDAMLRTYFSSLEELKRILGTKNTEAFNEYFAKAASHFKEESEEAMAITNKAFATLK